jgi:hypothetical protein
MTEIYAQLQAAELKYELYMQCLQAVQSARLDTQNLQQKLLRPGFGIMDTGAGADSTKAADLSLHWLQVTA